MHMHNTGIRSNNRSSGRSMTCAEEYLNDLYSSIRIPRITNKRRNVQFKGRMEIGAAFDVLILESIRFRVEGVRLNWREGVPPLSNRIFSARGDFEASIFTSKNMPTISVLWNGLCEMRLAGDPPTGCSPSSSRKDRC